jgi:hypothetical protein
MPTEKKCKICTVVKPIAEFSKAGPKYYQSYCKQCAHAKRTNAYRAEAPLKLKYGTNYKEKMKLVKATK